MISTKGISVVIPNYNGILLLPLILPPLYAALNNTQLNYEVIISDDCSTDDSVTFLQAQFPQIILLQSQINKGFSPAINKGIFIAKYDYLLLLNSDVKLSTDYFKNLLPYFEDKDTFGVMGRIIGWDDDTIQDGGKYPSFHGVKIKTSGNYIPVESKTGDKLYSMYLSGANAFVSKEKINMLVGFDELFAPFYVEDFELSLRAWRLGWKCYYEHNAICRHQTSTTIKSNSSKNVVKAIYYRNKMFLHAIHLQGLKLILWYVQLIPEIILHIVTGRFWFFTSLRMFFSSQKEIQQSKRNFTRLKDKESELLSVKEVVLKIKSSLDKFKTIPIK
ncbi:MAG: glycosyltransferase family 2 protein [Ferruginibacter sp.]|nr:glycosyltransferase family 2 protein [Ferruginibacter sp.]